MHPSDAHLHIGLVAMGFLTGGGLSRLLIYIAKNLAPLPKDAGFWATTLYQCVKGLSGLDPNASIIPQHAMEALMGGQK